MPTFLSLLLVFSLVSAETRAEVKGKVLVVLSSRSAVALRKPGEKKEETVPSGFSLPGLIIPVLQLVRAGYSPVFASPLGEEAALDPATDGVKAFAGDEKRYRQARTLCEIWGVCTPGETTGKVKLFKLAQIKAQGLGGFAGLLVPGGRAVLEDLWKDPILGAILKEFHAAKKPTALLGHGVFALLSTLKDPPSFVDAAVKGEAAGARALSESWIYRNYWMTATSSKDEETAGVVPRLYCDQALDQAGGKVQVRAIGGRVNVLLDRELVTGENEASAELLGETFAKALDARLPRRRR